MVNDWRCSPDVCPWNWTDFDCPPGYFNRTGIHEMAASLALDGYPARWPRPRRTPVAR
jgi:hypothetical protein